MLINSSLNLNENAINTVVIYEENEINYISCLICDTPRPWGLFFQDSATPQMEGIEELHNNILYYLFIIMFAVTWVAVSIVRNYIYNRSRISHKYQNHGTLVELI
jgi:cytochrome c oxidase subunit 2